MDDTAQGKEQSLSLPRKSFKAIVHSEHAGGYWAEVPELDGCFTQGETLDDVYHNLTEAIACHLDMDPDAIQINLLEMVAAS